MKKAILYVHGKGGNAQEGETYRKNCPGFDIFGVDYQDDLPWIAKEDIRADYEKLRQEYETIYLVANSIGAFFSMLSLQNCKLEKALFISPILNMERLITDMMGWAGVTEGELQAKGEIETNFGETLSWEYLQYVRGNPIHWEVPTEVLYAGQDNLTSRQTVAEFVSAHNAGLTVMEDGEHWFHTKEQLAFLDDWMKHAVSKENAYQALIQEVRESYQSEPGGLKWCDDCKEINLWTYWQGKGNLDAKIMLVGQDWGNPWADDMRTLTDCIRVMNERSDTPYIQDFDNPTDINLIRLFQSIGYDIVNVKNKDLFFTNFVLGYRTKGISGNFQKEWAEHDKGYFARLVNIIEPETILCLGRDTFAGVLAAFPEVILPRIQSYNRFIESKENPVLVSLPTGRLVRIFALAHCGKLGTLNRNRSETDKTSLQKQMEDWSRIL